MNVAAKIWDPEDLMPASELFIINHDFIYESERSQKPKWPTVSNVVNKPCKINMWTCPPMRLRRVYMAVAEIKGLLHKPVSILNQSCSTFSRKVA